MPDHKLNNNSTATYLKQHVYTHTHTVTNTHTTCIMCIQVCTYTPNINITEKHIEVFMTSLVYSTHFNKQNMYKLHVFFSLSSLCSNKMPINRIPQR